MKNILLFAGAALIILEAIMAFKPKDVVENRPNIILIVADDLGYSDLASYGNQYIHTPNIDQLGIDGVRFTDAYVTSPICGPSRAGIMTGRYQERFGSEFMPYEKLNPDFMHNLRKNYFSIRKHEPGLKTLHPHFFLNRSKYNTGLPSGEITIAELLQQSGYATGIVGKWNLGSDTTLYPDEHGYDYSYYFSGALTRYVDDPVDTNKYVNVHLPWAFSELPAWQPRYGGTAIHEGRNIVKDTDYSTFSFTDKAIKFIDKNKNRPFFLTLTYNAPHDPFQAPKEYFDRIKNVNDSVKRVYYAMIEALDNGVGKVMQKLKDLHLEENTIVIFISDNGGATYTRATDNAPLRGGKCTHFEGGLVVPFFIKYPKHIPGGIVYNSSVSSLDIFSTIAKVTNTTLPGDRVYDGVDLLPYINGEKKDNPHKQLYWRSGYSKAYIKDTWKLYVNEKDNLTYLFDLSVDREEKNDLSKSNPEKLKELLNDLSTWEKTQTIKPAWPSAADVTIDVRGVKLKFPT
ncbi:sulfatase-like hydrolase/transferase [Chitinophagaceae bacterium LWZ2-11]